MTILRIVNYNILCYFNGLINVELLLGPNWTEF